MTARSSPFLAARREILLVGIALVGLSAGGIASVFAPQGVSTSLWTVGALPVLVALLLEILASLRRWDFGLDLVAALSMTAALVFGEALAANVVALMYAGGQMLERYAEGRARSEMTALIGRVARTAMRRSEDKLVAVPIDALVPGDTIYIRQGEVVPVDGRLISGQRATLDKSTLTGESLPQVAEEGAEILSGSTSLDTPFEMIVLRRAAESTYAGIVRLVEAAQTSKAPMTRLADRYALGFLLVTIALALLAWVISGSPTRAVAVLVVATPCPLILAVPVALMSGVSRAAKGGVLLKSGGALEAMAGARTLVIDKTGTLTHGRARVSGIEVASGFAEEKILQVAASLDQASPHVLATALIEAARARGIALTLPSAAKESPGAGIAGVVDGHHVIIGGRGFLTKHLPQDAAWPWTHSREQAAVQVMVAIDGKVAGRIVLDDPLRDGAADAVAQLRRLGFAKVILASGDEQSITARAGSALAVDEVHAPLDPAGKAALVASQSGPVMMVGDGVNDAPALASAAVGVAMGARGSIASAETANAVILVDELHPLINAVRVAKRSRAIALQSVAAGLTLSLAAMVVAAMGYLPPVQGALLQEAIDVAVILNALRALR